ncbi:MAG: hypothetical protein MJE66_21965, partial [Proteobacteria bacterium]|nr:hypothetical protein [Pseudomonadota bacterium]
MAAPKPDLLLHGPERLVDQGLGPHQEESGNRAIHALLCDAEVDDQVDLVITHRRGADGEGDAYEVWARRGLVRFRRWRRPEGGLEFEVIEVQGENPLENQSDHALRTVEEEAAAAVASGFDAAAERRFVRAEHQSYPRAYERVAQLFDSPNAPDLVISPNDWAQGSDPGQHGALHVRQARAPLWFAGAGVARGVLDRAARAVDIAPTALSLLGFPLIDGADASGRTSGERGAAPDVYLRRQDGDAIGEVRDPESTAPRYLYIFLLDGLHHTEL